MPDGDLGTALVVTALACIPALLSLVALVDAARRPEWAWALAGRRQVVWIAAILVGFLTVAGGVAVSGWYLWRVRPHIGAAERGRLS